MRPPPNFESGPNAGDRGSSSTGPAKWIIGKELLFTGNFSYCLDKEGYSKRIVFHWWFLPTATEEKFRFFFLKNCFSLVISSYSYRGKIPNFSERIVFHWWFLSSTREEKFRIFPKKLFFIGDFSLQLEGKKSEIFQMNCFSLGIFHYS